MGHMRAEAAGRRATRLQIVLALAHEGLALIRELCLRRFSLRGKLEACPPALSLQLGSPKSPLIIEFSRQATALLRNVGVDVDPRL